MGLSVPGRRRTRPVGCFGGGREGGPVGHRNTCVEAAAQSWEGRGGEGRGGEGRAGEGREGEERGRKQRESAFKEHNM